MRTLWLAIICGAALASPASGQTSPPLNELLEAAGRGDVRPAGEALAATNDTDVRTVLSAKLAASRLQVGVARDPVLQRLASSADPALRRAALGIITSAAFADGEYTEAARAGRLFAAALRDAGEQEDAAVADRTWQLAALLSDVPPQRVEGTVVTGRAAARNDKVGLPRVDLAINGVAQDAVFDTGANLSVLSAELAKRMGVAIRDTETRIGNGVAGTVSVKVGVADRLEIAGATLRHVVFLVIDDSQLSFASVPGGYDIKAIIGLPVLRALGRIRYEQSGRFTVQPPIDAPHAFAPLHASGNTLFADVRVSGAVMPLLLDTGASKTDLTARYAAAHPEVVEQLPRRSVQSASAGGARTQETATWSNVPLALGSSRLIHHALAVALPGEGAMPQNYGTLGSDVLSRFNSYTVDFAKMQLEVGRPVAVDGPS